MKTTKTKNRTRFDFRVNEKRGTEGDEYAKYIEMINELTSDLIPFSTGRMCYLMQEDNDDCIMYISVDNDYCEFLDI